LGAPGFSYRVGGCVVSKDGALDTGDMSITDVSDLVRVLSARGFAPAEEPEIVGDENVMAIELPTEGFTDPAFDNLEKLVAGKAALIRMAVGEHLAGGAEPLPIVRKDETVCFPWFRPDMDTEAAAAWSCFFSALLAAAKKQNRVVLKEKPLEEGASLKFAMRYVQ
jgi:hypothetical protein